MAQIAATECHHCHAPRPTGAHVEDGRIQCKACDRYYTAMIWVADQQPDPPRQPAKPKPEKGKRIDIAPELPADLVQLGFKVVLYDDTMAAVSPSYGCSVRSADLSEVIRTARHIAGFVRYMKQKEQE